MIRSENGFPAGDIDGLFEGIKANRAFYGTAPIIIFENKEYNLDVISKEELKELIKGLKEKQVQKLKL